jgi:hypothetical protein
MTGGTMTAPDEETIRRLLERSYELWNAGDKDGYVANLQELAPGGFSLEDPVGTPPKETPQSVAEMFDGDVGWKMITEQIIVCGNSAARISRAEGMAEGQPVSVRAVDTFDFADDGSVHIRVWYGAPATPS